MTFKQAGFFFHSFSSGMISYAEQDGEIPAKKPSNLPDAYYKFLYFYDAPIVKCAFDTVSSTFKFIFDNIQ